MKSSSSCFGTLILAIVAAALLRFALPGVWHILAVLFTGTLLIGSIVLLLIVLTIGFFTYKNLKGNEQKREAEKLGRVTRAEALYGSVVERLQRDMVLNQVSAEELLQSEVLITDKLRAIKEDLIRLKDFTSPKNEKEMSRQMREYQDQLRQSSDESVKHLLRQNIKIVEEKRRRFQQAQEEIRQKEGMADLVYNNLLNADENLRFGRPLTRVLPAEVYSQFGLTPPSDQQQLPPLIEKSSTTHDS
jgi:hypothetical protein